MQKLNRRQHPDRRATVRDESGMRAEYRRTTHSTLTLGPRNTSMTPSRVRNEMREAANSSRSDDDGDDGNDSKIKSISFSRTATAPRDNSWALAVRHLDQMICLLASMAAAGVVTEDGTNPSAAITALSTGLVTPVSQSRPGSAAVSANFNGIDDSDSTNVEWHLNQLDEADRTAWSPR